MATDIRTMVCMLAVATAPALAAAADEESLERLRAMPIEQRKALSKNLTRFDLQSREERAALKDLDRRIGEADPVDRARYYSVLRRYHLWLRGLTEEQRQKLDTAPAEKRIFLVESFLKAQRATATPDTVWTQASALSPRALVEEAYWIKVWHGLSAEEKKELAKAKNSQARIQRLEKFGADKGLHVERAAMRKAVQQSLDRQLRDHPKAQRVYETQKAKANFGRPLQHAAEAVYINSFKAAAVDPKTLKRFADSIPGWLREAIDPLPPDATKSRLTILYRMIYQDREMPAAAAAPAEPEPKPGPAAKMTTAPASGSAGKSPF